MQLWQIITGLLTLIFGGGWLTQYMKNRGDAATKRVDELGAYRKELREDLDKQEKKYEALLEKQSEQHKADLKTQADAHEKALAGIADTAEKNHKEQLEKYAKLDGQYNEMSREFAQARTAVERLDRALYEDRLQREAFEDRILFMIEYRLADTDAWNELAAELREKQAKRKRTKSTDGATLTNVAVSTTPDSTKVAVSVSAPGTPIEPGTPRCRVLVIDDNEDTRRVMKILFERHGFDAEVVETGAQGLVAQDTARAEGRYFDFIISDYSMPGMDGGDVAHMLHRSGALSGDHAARLIFYTGNAQWAQDAKIDGATIWEKPLEGNEIIARLRAFSTEPQFVAQSIQIP